MVPEKFRLLIDINPLAQLVEAYRRILLEGAWPDWRSMIILTLLTILSLRVGHTMYRRLAPGFADRL
jgi:ABC-type polysaccharide/polyol phosphate export permease